MPRQLTSEQRALVEQLEVLAELFESRFRIFGIRVGWDAILGLFPGFGDTITGVVALYVVWAGYRLGLSRWTLARMGFNVLLDVGLGALPLVGGVLDVFFRANTRNVRLIRRELAAAG